MRNTPQDKFKLAAKKRMLELDLSVTRLAVMMGLARNTVSMAINHRVLPSVRRKIAARLKLTEAA